MSKKEKLLLLKDILDAHFEYFSFMSEEELVTLDVFRRI
jgi:hypothetical protein